MKVLITGIASGIGKELARQLVAQNDEVVGLDRRGWPDAPPGVEICEVDIRKRAAEEIFRRRRPDAAVHMATTHMVGPSDERSRINLGGTRAVFEYSRAYGVRHTLFVGRHTYYGAAPDSPLYHTEDEPPMAVHTFPELADLVAADLYAQTSLWRTPELTTTVLRICYTLGPLGEGTLAAFLRGPRVPTVLGFDPLFQFMHEHDVARAICLALAKQVRGVYNIAGPHPLPLSTAIRGAGRTRIPIPEFLFPRALGRFGLPKLPEGALTHVKYPVVVDAAPFRAATGFTFEVDEIRALREFREAFPVEMAGDSEKKERGAAVFAER
jgi:UDP-glucose 4-epimerase